MKYSRFFLNCCLLIIIGGCSMKAKSPAEDYRDGLLLSNQLIEQCGQDTYPGHQQYLDYLRKRLASSLPDQQSEYPYQLILINCAQPMAYSPGGGYILISKGLIKQLQNEAELAFVLSHEIAHYHLGHTLLTHDSNALEAVSHYQKELELKADRFAIGLVALAGYDPRYAVYALGRAYSLSLSPNQNSSYPSMEERMGMIRKEIIESKWQPPGTVDRRGFRIFWQSL